MNRLQEIIARKSEEIALAKRREAEFRARSERRTDFRDFASAVRRRGGPLKIVAEMKKASPSAGIIASDYEPASIARRYEASGANAVSVLTETNYFFGSLDHVAAAHESISLPVLRKDFIVEKAQVFESAASQADAILLIVAALEPKQLQLLYDCAMMNRLSALVEVHTPDEIQVAVDAGAKIIGINNRDLVTFTVDLRTTEKLLPHVPPGITIISESGIRNAEDIGRMSDFPIDALLIGESLMRADAVGLSKMLARS
ncbi:MAG: indole-3-glycerol phosphate synthase [Verrucomicrobiota bacterium]